MKSRARRGKIVAELELSTHTLGRRFESYWAHKLIDVRKGRDDSRA